MNAYENSVTIASFSQFASAFGADMQKGTPFPAGRCEQQRQTRKIECAIYQIRKGQELRNWLQRPDRQEGFGGCELLFQPVHRFYDQYRSGPCRNQTFY
jgi:hypothetical protein